jgi:hypothetical protein
VDRSRGHGLFHENVLAGLESPLGEIVMEVYLSGNNSGVDFRVSENSIDIGSGFDFRVKTFYVVESLLAEVTNGLDVTTRM